MRNLIAHVGAGVEDELVWGPWRSVPWMVAELTGDERQSLH